MRDKGSLLASLLPWAPAVAWMAVIFGASTLPGSSVPAGYSMYGHLAEYTVLGVLLLLPAARTSTKGRAALFALTVSSLYGVTDELHQFLTPGRTPDPADWLTDTVGAALGVLGALLVLWLLGRRSRASERPSESR